MTGAQIPKEAAELVHVQILNRADKAFAQTIAFKASTAVEQHIRYPVVPCLNATLAQTHEQRNRNRRTTEFMNN